MQIPEKGTQSDTEFPQSYAEIFEKTVFLCGSLRLLCGSLRSCLHLNSYSFFYFVPQRPFPHQQNYIP